MFFAQTLGKHDDDMSELYFWLRDVMSVELTRTLNMG